MSVKGKAGAVWNRVKKGAGKVKSKAGGAANIVKNTKPFNNIAKAHNLAKKRSYMPSDHVKGYVAAFLRTFGFIFLSIGLGLIFQGRPIFKLVPLILLAFAMLTYPNNITSGSPHGEEIGLAIFKIILGLALTGMFIATFRQGLAAPGRANWLLFSFSILALGFFSCVVPESLGRGSGGNTLRVNVNIVGGSTLPGFKGLIKYILLLGLVVMPIFLISWMFLHKGMGVSLLGGGAMSGASLMAVGASIIGGVGILMGGFAMGKINEIVFSICVFAGLFTGAIGLAGTTIALLMFLTIVFIGGIGGLPAADARPILGIPILVIALFAATAAYPSIMGEAVFGQWWAPVYTQFQSLEQSMSPMFNQFSGVSQSLGRGWKCLGSPTQCYQQYNKPQTQVSKTYRALAVSQMNPTGTGSINEPPTQYTNPKIPVLLSTIEIGNMLRYDEVDNPPTIDNVTIKTTPVYDAVYKKRTLGGPEDIQVSADGKMPKISGGGCGGWEGPCGNETFGPGMKARYTLNITGGTDNFKKDIEPNNYLKYGVNITYPITSHSVLDVEVMNSGRFNELLQRDQLEFSSPTSTYEWGPVSIAIGVGQQPVQGGSTVPLIVYVKNRGQGYLKEIKSFNISVTNESFVKNDGVETCSVEFNDTLVNNLEYVSKQNEGSIFGMASKKEISAQCLIELENPDVNLKTYGLTADMEYLYQLVRTDTVEVMYQCANDDDCKDYEDCVESEGLCDLKKGNPKCFDTGSNNPGSCTEYCARKGYDCGGAACEGGANRVYARQDYNCNKKGVSDCGDSTESSRDCGYNVHCSCQRKH